MIGNIVDARYELLERIGEGTFFTVFKGQDRVIDRPVAVKVLYPRYAANPDFVTRLRNELTAAGKLTHHAIARVYETGEFSGNTYVATEYVRGTTLKERIRRQSPVSFSEAVDLAISVADALAFAHRAGFVHGDVTPQNILLTPEMQIKITDFGVSRAAVGSALVQSNAMLRGVHYLAPEVAEGQEPSPASDAYALGVILFEMLTGTLPYQGDTPLAVALKHAQEPIPSPRALNPSVPRALEGIVMKALAKNPAERYPSAFAMLRDLRRAQECIRLGRPLSWSPLEHQPAAAAPEPEDDKPVRDGWRIATTVLLLLVVVLLAGVSAFLFGGLGIPPDVTVPDIVGKTQAEAEGLLGSSGLKLMVVSRQHDSKVPAGSIIHSPEVGRQVKKGAEVRAVVSEGPEQVTVPDVRNGPEGDARQQLVRAGLQVSAVRREYDEQVPAGQVSMTEPAPGTRVAKETRVTLTISRGPFSETTTTPPPTPEPRADPRPPRSSPRRGKAQRWDVEVNVPVRGPERQVVRIVVIEGDRETESYKGSHEPGEKLIRVVQTRGPATIRVLVDDQVLQEKHVDTPPEENTEGE